MVTMRVEWGGVVLSALIACGGEEPAADSTPVVEVPGVNTMMEHGDHSAKNGGTVWMHGDLHFEVVLDPAGAHRVYFSDAARLELPAAVATGVRVTILRAGAEAEVLTLTIDEYGESWVAAGAAVDDPEARAIVSFANEKEGPYEIDVPFIAEPIDPTADPHSMH